MYRKVGVIGMGSFGVAIANLLSNNTDVSAIQQKSGKNQ